MHGLDHTLIRLPPGDSPPLSDSRPLASDAPGTTSSDAAAVAQAAARAATARARPHDTRGTSQPQKRQQRAPAVRAGRPSRAGPTFPGGNRRPGCMPGAAPGYFSVVIGRIPVLDVEPQVDCGRRPAKATVGETLQVTATVFREGHEMPGAQVVLRDPSGCTCQSGIMREIAEGTDRYGAEVSPTGEGLWHFRVESWGDPAARWRHDSAIKVPIGQDVELMLAEGALLFDRAARQAGDIARAGGKSSLKQQAA